MNEFNNTPEEQLKYYTICHNMAVKALSVYESYEPGQIDSTVVEYQRHRVKITKHELENFKKKIGSGSL